MERLTEIKEVLNKATPGPWRTPPTFSGVVSQKHGDICYRGKSGTSDDIVFICFAPEYIRYLIDELEAANKRLEEYEKPAQCFDIDYDELYSDNDEEVKAALKEREKS